MWAQVVGLVVALGGVSMDDQRGLATGWQATAGKWAPTRAGFKVEGSLDNRLMRKEPAPESFEWSVTVELKSGWSAGVLVGASEEGSRAYCIRLDSRMGKLALAEIGPWPHEKLLAEFPWEPINGAKAKLRVEVGPAVIRVREASFGNYTLLEAALNPSFGTHIGLYSIDSSATFELGSPRKADVRPLTLHVPEVGAFEHVYDPLDDWYINDHCLVKGADGWHMFGITQVKPAKPTSEVDFAHATTPTLAEKPWTKQSPALSVDTALGERHLWAPHVIKRGDTFYMFYCAGSGESNYHYRIHLATSKDLWSWKRHPGNPLFQDFFDARDPMVLEDNGVYFLYYTAILDRASNHHVVNVRTSRDLFNWSPARVALRHPAKGSFGGPTESPFVVKYGDHYYLFCGPDGDYRRTVVYRSSNPYYWEYSKQIYSFPSHAAEVIEDAGQWYATNCGWDLDGVYLAPLVWRLAR